MVLGMRTANVAKEEKANVVIFSLAPICVGGIVGHNGS